MAAEALKTLTRNGYNAQGVNLTSRFRFSDETDQRSSFDDSFLVLAHSMSAPHSMCSFSFFVRPSFYSRFLFADAVDQRSTLDESLFLILFPPLIIFSFSNFRRG